MKESFDPLAEAQRRSDPQLVRYNETIGHDPSANADYAAYLRTRDFEDANGSIHDAKTSKFKKRNAENDTYETDLINSAHAEALEENALRDGSLESLAKKVAEARNSGDAQAAAHAEDLFFDKFTKLSEKYGWEEDDDSANDTLRVEKDAKVGRSTIDDRLARYSKIMYGEEADTAVKSSEVVAEEDSKVADRAEKEAESVPEEKSEEAPAATEEKFDVAAEVEQVKERLSQHALDREQQVNEERNSTESAKADRELLQLVSKEGLEDFADKPSLKLVSKEGLEAEGDDEPKLVSKEGLDAILEDTEVEPARPEKGFLNRARHALHKSKELYLRAAFEVGHTLDLAKSELSKRGGRKPGETEEQYERRMRRNGQGVALGIVALAGASIAAKFGAFDGLFDGNANASASGNTEAAAESTDRGSRGGGVETSTQQFSNDSLRVDRGEGLFQTFKEMGIPKDKWQEVLNQSGPKLVRMGEAYNDPSIGGFGLKGDGRLSTRALGVIADTARNVK